MRPLVLQLAVVCVSCFGAVTQGRALSTSRLDSEPPLAGAQGSSVFTSHLNTVAGETSSGRFHHTDVTGSSDGRPEDLEDSPTPFGRSSSVGHEDSLPGTVLHGRRESFVTGPLQESIASSESDILHRRREREAPTPWLSDDEGSGYSSEMEWDDEDLFLQQRRAARRGRKGGPTSGRRKNADWLQQQGVTPHHSGHKPDHSRQQVAAKNELPSQEQGPRPSRRPQHANAAKRRSKKRHRMKELQPQAHSTSLPPHPAEAAPGGGGGRRSQRQHQRQRQHHQLQQPEHRPPHRTTTAQPPPPPPPPPPRKFGGGDMSLESRIRALKKIATSAEEDEPIAAQPLELPAYYPGDSGRWGPQDEWASGYDQRLWKVLGSGGTGTGGSPDYEDTGSAPVPPPQPPSAATPPPPPPTRPPPPGHSTAATPVIAGAAAHVPQPTQSRHFAYHRVTEAQSAAAAASHHQEAFVAVSMVELPGNHSREHPARGHEPPSHPASAENVSTRTAGWEAAGAPTAASLFPVASAALSSDVIGGDHWTSGGDPWVSRSRSGGSGGGGLQALPTWFRLRHRGRNHFRKGAMEELMNRHREEQWLRRRLGLPPESPHQQFSG